MSAVYLTALHISLRKGKLQGVVFSLQELHGVLRLRCTKHWQIETFSNRTVVRLSA